MSHKPFDEREISDATPELMRKELDKYFAHVQQHDPKSPRARSTNASSLSSFCALEDSCDISGCSRPAACRAGP